MTSQLVIYSELSDLKRNESFEMFSKEINFWFRPFFFF